MDLGIKGKRAIVTDCSSGIGFETARQFLEESVRILITGRDPAKRALSRNDLAKRRGAQSRRQEKRARSHGQARRTCQCHRVPVFGARELYHRRINQS